MAKYIFILLFPTYIFSQVRYVDDVFTDISQETYEYGNKGDESLQLDFYNPENDLLEKRPLVIFMHGGGFSIGQRDDNEIKKLAIAFAKKGYPVASISYRLTRKGKGFNCNTPVLDKKEAFRHAGEDLLDAVCYLTDKKEQFRIDTSKIVIAGSSAGAEAILAATYNKSVFFKDIERYNDIKPAVIISLAGALIDIDALNKKSAIPGVFFHGTDDPLVPYSSGPHHFCDPEKPGYLILHGSKSITDKLEKLNTSFLLYTIEGGKHDIFETTDEKLKFIFDFLNVTLIKKEFYQEKVIK